MQTSHAPHGSKARLQDITTRRRFMAKPCTPHLIAQRVQLFELQSGNVGGRGEHPSPFSGGSKGGILFGKRIPPLNPPEKGEGSSPRPPTLAVCSLKSCTRCAIGCGVHGFAMNPCDSTHPATAPYYREARVTVERRQTAYRMRHCFARRIVECSVRRKLGCTTTRLAEQQRIVGVGQIVLQC